MKYRTIVADPPWDLASPSMRRQETGRQIRSLPVPYAPMSLGGIMTLPVAEWADYPSRLFLWTTNSFLRDSFDVMTAWGFSYRQTLVWHKKASVAPGSVAPNSAEFLMVAVKGSPPRRKLLPSAVIPVVQPYGTGANHGPLHSAKPECFLDYIEQVSPGPYLELFARRNRLGWDTWGNESLEHVELV